MKYDLFLEEGIKYIDDILNSLKKSKAKYNIEIREEKINGEYNVISIYVQKRAELEHNED